MSDTHPHAALSLAGREILTVRLSFRQREIRQDVTALPGTQVTGVNEVTLDEFLAEIELHLVAPQGRYLGQIAQVAIDAWQDNLAELHRHSTHLIACTVRRPGHPWPEKVTVTCPEDPFHLIPDAGFPKACVGLVLLHTGRGAGGRTGRLHIPSPSSNYWSRDLGLLTTERWLDATERVLRWRETMDEDGRWLVVSNPRIRPDWAFPVIGHTVVPTLVGQRRRAKRFAVPPDWRLPHIVPS